MITLSIGENRMKIRQVGFEFIANRQTDRRAGALFLIICIDIRYAKILCASLLQPWISCFLGKYAEYYSRMACLYILV